MIIELYGSLQKLPRFRGRARLEAMLRRRLAPRLYDVDGLKMQLDPLEWLQIEMMSGKATEPATVQLFKRLLRPGETVVDVGAHVGYHALFSARAVGAGGRVIAIEPQPYNCERIMANALANSFENILTICAAAGDVSGWVKLRQQVATDKARLSLAGQGVSDTGVAFEVPVVSLDEVYRREKVERARLLKIDVEGFEREVLAGAGSALAATENVVLEVLPTAGESHTGAVIAALIDSGFSLRDVLGNPWDGRNGLVEGNLWAHRS